MLRGVRDALALPAWVVGLSLFAVGSLAGESGFPAGAADLAHVFRWVFAAALAGFALALLFLVLMEEKPLRGSAARAADAAVAD